MTFKKDDVKEVLHNLRVAYTLMCHLKIYDLNEDSNILDDFSNTELETWVKTQIALDQFFHVFDEEHPR